MRGMGRVQGYACIAMHAAMLFTAIRFALLSGVRVGNCTSCDACSRTVVDRTHVNNYVCFYTHIYIYMYILYSYRMQPGFLKVCLSVCLFVCRPVS